MGDFAIRMPDIGEGIAEAEIIEWLVDIGEDIATDAPLVEVMTDKARVQIPSPVAGKVLRLGGEPGESIAVGAELIRLTVAGSGNVSGEKKAKSKPADPTPEPEPERPAEDDVSKEITRRERAAHPVHTGRVLAAPAVRTRAREAGVDLASIPGSGPGSRVTQADLDDFLGSGSSAAEGVEEIPLTGVRRATARRMQDAWTRIPHITIVEEVDVTELQTLRTKLNERDSTKPRLTVLPFVVLALVRAIADHPEVNAHLDDEAEVVRRFAAVHVGIATQGPDGLRVPVIPEAQAQDLWQVAESLATVSEAARDGTATREQLTGSTITVTSLGKLGAMVTTPIINAPEVAIVGVNRMATKPMWDGSAFVPRTVMNVSCSFDHRVIDGWEAARFVARLKDLLETPGLLFLP